MTATPDWSKKFYKTTRNFPDHVDQLTNKTIWNRVLNRFPNLAEFFRTGKGKEDLTTLERSMREFIIQSEFIKPYAFSTPYVENEDVWPVPPGGFPPPDPPPPDPGGEGETDPGPYPPEDFICHAVLRTGCWCEDDNNGQDFVITGTYPIESIEVLFHTNAVVKVTAGLGTRRVEGIVKASKHVIQSIPIKVWMTHPLGTACWMNLFIYPCSEKQCCEERPIDCDEDNQTTIGGSSSVELLFTGGKKKYTYTVTGSGFWLDSGHSITEKTSKSRKVIVYTDAAACGPGIVSVEDSCNSEAECEILCTNGVWDFKGAGCIAPGADDVPSTCFAGQVCERIDGDVKQQDRYGSVSGNSGSCSITPCDTKCPSVDECILFDHCGSGASVLNKNNMICCWIPCTADPGSYLVDQVLCYNHSAGYPRYWLWECPP